MIDNWPPTDHNFQRTTAILTDVEKATCLWHSLKNIFDTSNKFRTEEKNVNFCEIKAVLNFVGCITEIQRNDRSPRLEDTKINRQPLDAVHEQNTTLFLTNPTAQKKMRQAVCLFHRKHAMTFEAILAGRVVLDQLILTPDNVVFILKVRLISISAISSPYKSALRSSNFVMSYKLSLLFYSIKPNSQT